MKRLAGIAFVFMLHFGAHAVPEVSTQLSTNVINVGDRVNLTLIATHAENQRLVVPSLQREPFIVVWDTRTEPDEPRDGNITTTAHITFSSFVIGEHRIATNALILLGPENDEQAIPFPELTVRVDSLLTNPPPSLADIKPAVHLPGYRWLRILWMLLAITAVAIALALLIRYWLRRKQNPPPAKIIPPHEIALTALDALRSRGYIERGEVEPFYVELSAIIRIYLEDRFHLHAPEQTTEEFIRTSSQSQVLTLEHRQLTQEFLEQSDLVKFARFQPSADDMARAWDAGAKLVRETMEAPPP